jgi:hypothetical protein
VIAQEEPQLVRKIVLAGTGPAGGEGIDKVTLCYLNLTIAGWVLALGIIALTRGRLGYRPEAAQEPRVC